MRFESGELALLAETGEIQIETVQPGGPSHRTIIWVLVDGEDVFVRSVNGAKARWYREAVANPSVTIHAGGRAIEALVIPAADPASIERTSAALKRKYRDTDGLREMLEPDVFDTTLRLDRA